MSRKKSCRPKEPSLGGGSKRIIPPPDVSSSTKNGGTGCISFSLKYVQSSFCITECEDEDKIAFIDAMHKRRDMTWDELHAAHRKGLGPEKISQDSIKPKIPSFVRDSRLYAFRFARDKRPMVGFRDEDVFYVVWFERKYNQLYDHD